MIKKLNNLRSYFYFIPKFFFFLNFFNFNQKMKVRPYFGIYIKNSGGPNIRTKRLIKSFGNYLFNPNIIYAQSFWTFSEIKDAIKYSEKYNIPIIFNQNGVYYKGWYNGNIDEKNRLIALIQKKSKFIFFQSNFCKESSIYFTKFKPRQYKILYNSVPLPVYFKKKVKTKNVFNVLIAGYFNKKNIYILEPAINTFYTLTKKNILLPRLIIYGLKIKILKKNLKKKIQYLIHNNRISIHSNYNIKNLKDILKDIHVALHLKYKDPCPNAVLERMHYGVPHIISDTGGTPELTGNSSINIKVKDSWERLIKVDEKKLYDAILFAKNNYGLLKKRTYKQIRSFKWTNYIKEHKKIFLKYTK